MTPIVYRLIGATLIGNFFDVPFFFFKIEIFAIRIKCSGLATNRFNMTHSPHNPTVVIITYSYKHEVHVRNINAHTLNVYIFNFPKCIQIQNSNEKKIENYEENFQYATPNRISI